MGHEITQVWIGDRRVGLMGLNEAFAEVRALGLTDDEAIKAEIIRRVGRANYIPAEVETEYGRAFLLEYRRFSGERVEEEGGKREIRILGPGCPRCEELMRRVMTAVAELDLPVDVQHVHDLNQIAGFGPVATPALAVDGKVKVVGKVPSVDELKRMFTRRNSRA